MKRCGELQRIDIGYNNKLSGFTTVLDTIMVCKLKPVHAVTCIKRSHFSCPVIENFISIEPLLRGHLFKRPLFLCHKGDLLIQVWLLFISQLVLSKRRFIFIFWFTLISGVFHSIRVTFQCCFEWTHISNPQSILIHTTETNQICTDFPTGSGSVVHSLFLFFFIWFPIAKHGLKISFRMILCLSSLQPDVKSENLQMIWQEVTVTKNSGCSSN